MWMWMWMWMARMIWWSNNSSPFYTRGGEKAAIAAIHQSRIYRIFRRNDRQRQQQYVNTKRPSHPTVINLLYTDFLEHLHIHVWPLQIVTINLCLSYDPSTF